MFPPNVFIQKFYKMESLRPDLKRVHCIFKANLKIDIGVNKQGVNLKM